MVTKHSLLFSTVLVLSIFTSTTFAERGGFRGGNFGNDNFHHDEHNDFYYGQHNDIYHGENDNVIYHNNYPNAAPVIVVPGGCSTQQVCDSSGQCWSEQNCN